MKRLLEGSVAARILRGELAAGRCGHAYLLLFEDEGYLREALRFFAALLYAGDARKCSLIERESFADCLFFPKADKKPSVEDAAAILDESVVRPIEGGKKIFVFDRFQEANAAVQNKLLKGLEEPPEGVCFLLGATHAYSVLPTVLSRVERLEVPRFSAEELTAFLERNHPDRSREDCAEAAAVGALPSKAEEFLSGGAFRACLDYAFRAAEVKASEIPALAGEIASLGQKESFPAVFKLVLRDLLMREIGASPLLSRCADGTGYTAAALTRAIDLVSETERAIALNANYRQAMEVLLSRIEEEKIWSK